MSRSRTRRSSCLALVSARHWTETEEHFRVRVQRLSGRPYHQLPECSDVTAYGAILARRGDAVLVEVVPAAQRYYGSPVAMASLGALERDQGRLRLRDVVSREASAAWGARARAFDAFGPGRERDALLSLTPDVQRLANMAGSKGKICDEADRRWALANNAIPPPPEAPRPETARGVPYQRAAPADREWAIV